MKRNIKKAVVLALSTGLALTSVAGCSKKEENKFNTEAAAITVNGEELSVGVVNFAIRYTQASLESLYMSLGATDPFNQDLFGVGSTLGDQAKEQITAQLGNAMLAEQHMEDYGVAVTDDDKAAITAAAEQFMSDNDEEVLSALSASQEIVERYLELSLIQNRMETAMTADVDTEVSDEEAAQRKIQYAIFAPVTEEELEAQTEAEETEEESSDKGEAETAGLEENDADKTRSSAETETDMAVTAGTEPESEADVAAQAAAEAVSDALAEAETEAETEDPETAAARERAYAQAVEMIEAVKAGSDFAEAAESMGKTVSDRTFGADYSVTELVEATDGLPDGTLVEEPVYTSTGSYYVVYLETQLDRDATDTEKENIVRERKQDCIDALYEEWAEDAPVSVDEEVMSAITFEYHLETPQETELEEETEVTEADTEGEAAETEMTEADTEEEAAETEMTDGDTDGEAAETEMTEADTDGEAAETEVSDEETEAGTEAE